MSRMTSAFAVQSIVILVAGAIMWVVSREWAAGVALAILLALPSLTVLTIVGANRLGTRLLDAYPVSAAFVYGVSVIPVGGICIAALLDLKDANIAQGAVQFSLLAQVIVILLVALSVEIAGKRLLDTHPMPREAAALIVGIHLGAVLGLAAAIWGAFSGSPGLVFVGIAGMAVLTLAMAVLAIPLRSLRDPSSASTEAPTDSAR